MKKTNRTQLIGSIIISVAAIASIVYMAGATPDGQAGNNDKSKPAAAQATSAQSSSVLVTQAKRQPLTRTLRMPATLLADEQVDLFSKTSGYLASINVDIGDRVSKGDVLAVVDVPEMVDDLRQAEAMLEATKAKVKQAQAVTETARAEVGRCHAEYQLEALNIQRKKELRKANAIPEQELDEAKSKFSIAEARGRIAQAGVTSGEADVMVAEAEVIQAAATMGRIKTLMNYATIRAPFDGVVTRRLVDHGDFVRSAADGASSPMFTVAKVDRIRISLEIPESDVPDVRIGTEVVIEIKALRDKPIQATITRTAYALDPSTRTMRAEVDLDNQNMKLLPGMYAQVDIKLESMESALVIPSKAIRVRGTELSVLVASNNIVKKMPIEIGYDDGIVAEIVGGLVGDELIITSATSAISPGVAVNPVLTHP